MRSLIVSLLLALLVLPGLSGCGSGNKSNPLPYITEGMDLTGSKQGQAVAFVDVDGDGYTDKLVGAPNFKTSSGRYGIVLVYKGSASGFDSMPTSMLEGDDNFGYSILNTGDLDGDGKDDFAVAAIHGDGDDVSLCGSVTLYKGGGKGQIIKKLSGEWPMDKFGFSLAAGDLNGDGHRDIVVGAPFNTNSASLYQAGAVYMFFGPDFVNKTALYATKANKALGLAVATGDINGDTLTDLLISSNDTVSGVTTTYTVLGFYGVDQPSAFSPTMTAPDVTITSAVAGFGKALAVIGDIDTNKGDEIAIGAPNAVLTLAGVSTRDVGSVYIVSTASGTVINVDAAPAGSLLARLDGETLFSRFGSSLAAVGDVDANGKPDLAVGAPMADAGWNTLSGKVYLFKGESMDAGSLVFEGMVKNQGYGTSLAFADNALLIGAPRSNADTGGSAMVDPATGMAIPGGNSGGSSGGGGSCH